VFDAVATMTAASVVPILGSTTSRGSNQDLLQPRVINVPGSCIPGQ